MGYIVEGSRRNFRSLTACSNIDRGHFVADSCKPLQQYPAPSVYFLGMKIHAEQQYLTSHEHYSSLYNLELLLKTKRYTKLKNRNSECFISLKMFVLYFVLYSTFYHGIQNKVNILWGHTVCVMGAHLLITLNQYNIHVPGTQCLLTTSWVKHFRGTYLPVL